MDPSSKHTDNVDWDLFSSQAYAEKNYQPLHKIDESIIAVVKSYLQKHAASNLTVADIGAGPNLYPMFLLLPHAKELDLIEYSKQNIAYLQDQINSPDEMWLEIYRYIFPENNSLSKSQLTHDLQRRVKVIQGSIYELPTQKFDIASMFFCAESITSDEVEFEQATLKYINSVKPGGILCAAFMENSAGYQVADMNFPAVKITDQNLKKLFTSHCTDLQITRFDEGANEIREGYSGMLVLVAKKA